MRLLFTIKQFDERKRELASCAGTPARDTVAVYDNGRVG